MNETNDKINFVKENSSLFILFNVIICLLQIQLIFYSRVGVVDSLAISGTGRRQFLSFVIGSCHLPLVTVI